MLNVSIKSFKNIVGSVLKKYWGFTRRESLVLINNHTHLYLDDSVIICSFSRVQ